MTNEKLKVAVLGAGRMGRLHLKKYLELSDRVDLVGFYDANPDHARAVSEELGVASFSKLSDLLFEIDAATIASPTPTHFPLAKEALNAGVHILIEKPMTETGEQAAELTALAKRKELILQVGFLERYRCRALLDSFPMEGPFFIEANRFSTVVGREASVDVVADLMIHDLDLALSLVKAEPTQICAVGGEVATAYVDIASVRIEFEDGSVASLSASRVAPVAERKFRIYAGAKTAFLDLVQNSADLSVRSRDSEFQRQVREAGAFDALRAQAVHFLETIEAKQAPLVGGEDGIRSLKYVGLIQEKISSRSVRSPFSVPLPATGVGAPTVQV